MKSLVSLTETLIIQSLTRHDACCSRYSPRISSFLSTRIYPLSKQL
jgi:hypothetical protein